MTTDYKVLGPDPNAIHIGWKIAEILEAQHKSKRELGDLIGMSASNAVYLTTRDTIDVRTLHKVGLALKYNFWKHFPIEEVAQSSIAKVSEGDGKTIDELKLKISDMEKQLENCKRDLMMQKQENVYLKKINELLEKK